MNLKVRKRQHVSFEAGSRYKYSRTDAYLSYFTGRRVKSGPDSEVRLMLKEDQGLVSYRQTSASLSSASTTSSSSSFLSCYRVSGVGGIWIA